jgi:ribonucleoside-diphosphate reductase alpha chain
MDYIHVSRYAKYLEEEKRRETWPETVDRYIGFFRDRFPDASIPWRSLRKGIHDKEAMPSMRAMMTAGPALERDHIAGYNCAFRAMKHPRRFAEIMYILMCGTGVGFSAERQYIASMPEVAEEMHDADTTITIADSKLGWASGLNQLFALLYSGQVPRWDLSRLRPAGARLRTFGGRASGPEPLDAVFTFAVEVFRRATGRRLTSIEVHDLVCKIAESVVCGGVRRSALIGLSNLSDDRMRHAKAGEWWHLEPQRALANNSVAYTEKPELRGFIEEWLALYDSKSGERGIFNREAAIRTAPERRDLSGHAVGTNPCGEITLRDGQFCNLSEVVARPGDDFGSLKRKVYLATILGTLQASLTDFRFIGADWKKNCEEEYLLGVSITGMMDNEITRGPSEGELAELSEYAVDVNAKFAKIIGIKPAAAVTCNKPSGTVSQLVLCGSGMHPWYARHFVRRVRADKTDPVSNALIDAGVPHEEDIHNPRAWVFSWPMKAPEGALVRHDLTAIDQLEHWLAVYENWAEHQSSVTIYVKEHEWLDVGAWVYKHFDRVAGLSFLPADDSAHTYEQAPYEEITGEQYAELVDAFPSEIDLRVVEEEDNTTGTQELACTAGVCEI